MNKRFLEQSCRQRLIQVSQQVRAESTAVSEELEAIEHDVEA